MHLPSRTALRRSPWLNSAVRESNVCGLDQMDINVLIELQVRSVVVV